MIEEGKITNVYYKNGVPVCSVILGTRTDTEKDGIPVIQKHESMRFVPKKGQTALMTKLKEQRFIIGVLKNGNNSGASDLQEGEAEFTFDDNTNISIREGKNGGYDVSISASGDLRLSADGDIFIGGTKQ
jgi:hypothetical protein